MSSCTFSFECHPSPLQCQPLECCLDCHSFQLGKVHKQQGIASADASSGLASPEQLQWMTFKSSSCATFLFVNDWRINSSLSFFPIPIQLGSFHWPSPSIPRFESTLVGCESLLQAMWGVAFQGRQTLYQLLLSC